jgi:hypothetical protein
VRLLVGTLAVLGDEEIRVAGISEFVVVYEL